MREGILDLYKWETGGGEGAALIVFDWGFLGGGV